MMMKDLDVMIVDDEQLVLESLKYVLSQFKSVHIVYESTDSLSALEYVKEKPDIDVIFVDISMPILNGLDFAEQVFEIAPNIQIVFVTAYEQYAIKSFGVNTVDYILKPVTVSRVKKVLDKLDKLYAGVQKKVPPPTQGSDAPLSKIAASKNNQFYIIDPQDAYFIMVQGNDIMLYTRDEEFRLKYTINYWARKLADQGWIRCHRSILINMNHIKSISPMFNSTYTVRMENRKEEIPVSRSYINDFKQALNL